MTGPHSESISLRAVDSRSSNRIIGLLIGADYALLLNRIMIKNSDQFT